MRERYWLRRHAGATRVGDSGGGQASGPEVDRRIKGANGPFSEVLGRRRVLAWAMDSGEPMDRGGSWPDKPSQADEPTDSWSDTASDRVHTY